MIWLGIMLLLACLGFAQEPITICMIGRSQGIPPEEATDPRSVARRTVFEEFHRQNPGIRVVNAGGLELQGDLGEAGLLMSMAGDTAPDVFYVNFRQYFSYIDQGFCRPLDDLISSTPGSLDRVQPEILEVLRSYDGKLYAIPFYQVAQALYYRKDHFREAGLDPNEPPKTWAEFYEYGQRLTEVKPGRSGFVFAKGPGGRAYWWTNFVWQAGGDVLVPAERGYSRAVVDTPEAAQALDFYRKLTINKWQGEDGKTYGPVAVISPDFGKDIIDGKISMWFAYTNDILLNISQLNPALLGIAKMPAGPAGSVNEINAGMWAINANVKDPEKLEACWKFIQFFVSQEAARVSTEKFVDFGMANLVNPALLKEFGYERLAATVDPGYVEANEALFKSGKPEPYGRNSQQVYLVLDAALDRAKEQPDRPAIDILKEVNQEMNQKLLGYTPEDVMQTRRGWAAAILLIVLGMTVYLAVRGIKAARKRLAHVDSRIAAGADMKRIRRFMFWTILPAALSVLVWSYYPLFQGLLIAFQDYRIMEGSSWVGLDNFIAAFTSPIFYKSLLNSVVFVALTIGVGFLLPILLALGLNEIPRFGVLFRVLFYLPAMTSPIVIAFMWRQFYDPSEAGVLNSMVGPLAGWINSVFHTQLPLAYDWLGDSSLAMYAVVIPGIWAAAGPGSILYLAALKNIPDERYEAADIDGANWMQKIRFITLPGLRALVLINLLGAFIAGFKATENIFVLTGGGPDYATHTIGLEVWTNAFLFLKYGYATAAAWVMGAILIGFTLVQMRYLLQMKFTAATR